MNTRKLSANDCRRSRQAVFFLFRQAFLREEDENNLEVIMYVFSFALLRRIMPRQSFFIYYAVICCGTAVWGLVLNMYSSAVVVSRSQRAFFNNYAACFSLPRSMNVFIF